MTVLLLAEHDNKSLAPATAKALTAARAFGSDVTLVEALPRIIPVEDEEISAELNKALTKRGIKIMTNTSLKSVERSDTQVVASVAGSDGRIGRR